MSHDPSSAAPQNASAPPAQRVGTIIGGRYRLERALPRAPSSWVATDEHLQAPSSLRLYGRSPDVYARLRATHDALSSVEHPGIQSSYDVGSLADGTIFVAAARVGVATLDECSSVGMRTAVRWAVELLRGLEAAHRAGVAHGGVCAAAVSLEVAGDGELHASLMHFVAGLIDEGDVDPTRAVCGDIDAVAGLLHELLTGRSPGSTRYAARPGHDRRVPSELLTIVADQLSGAHVRSSALDMAWALEPFTVDLDAARRAQTARRSCWRRFKRWLPARRPMSSSGSSPA